MGSSREGEERKWRGKKKWKRKRRKRGRKIRRFSSLFLSRPIQQCCFLSVDSLFVRLSSAARREARKEGGREGGRGQFRSQGKEDQKKRRERRGEESTAPSSPFLSPPSCPLNLHSRCRTQHIQQQRTYIMSKPRPVASGKKKRKPSVNHASIASRGETERKKKRGFKRAKK